MPKTVSVFLASISLLMTVGIIEELSHTGFNDKIGVGLGIALGMVLLSVHLYRLED